MTDPQTLATSLVPEMRYWVTRWSSSPLDGLRTIAQGLNIWVEEVVKLEAEVTRLTQERERMDQIYVLWRTHAEEGDVAVARLTQELDHWKEIASERMKGWTEATHAAQQAEADLLLCQQEKEEAESKVAGLAHAIADFQATYQQGIAPVVEAMQRRADAIDHNAADGAHATITVEQMLRLRATTYREIAGEWAETLARLLVPKEDEEKS